MSDALLLDQFVDAPDAAIAAHLIVDALPDVTFDAARTLDLLEIQTPLTASFWVRGLPAKVLHQPEPEVAEQFTLEGDLGLPGWTSRVDGSIGTGGSSARSSSTS